MKTKVFIPDAVFIWLTAEVDADSSVHAESVEVEITDPAAYTARGAHHGPYDKRTICMNHPALSDRRLPLQVRW